MQYGNSADHFSMTETPAASLPAPELTLDGPIVPTAEAVAAFKDDIVRHLISTLARDMGSATARDWWIATALACRERLHERMIATQAEHNSRNVRRVYYFSLEYLIGRLFQSNLQATGLLETARAAFGQLGQDFEKVREAEVDMGLGNGGLGRLAACFMDSLATLDYPALGYGIYYEFGLFRQQFVNGNQVEQPDNWTIFGNPWEVVRPEYTQEVQIYGRVENVFDNRGNYRPHWVDTRKILGVPHDIPIAGYGTRTVNLLRLWSSKSTEEFDLAAFNSGGYVDAVREKAVGETVSKVLISERQDGERQGAAARAAVFFRVLFAAGHHSPAFPHGLELVGEFRREGGGAAQRHAPDDRDHRAAAHPDR